MTGDSLGAPPHTDTGDDGDLATSRSTGERSVVGRPPDDPSPIADGGRPPDGLFESLPDPLLAHTSPKTADEADVASGADAGSAVIRAVNPAFEAVFEVEADEVVGRSLDGVELAGTVTPRNDGGDTNAAADRPGPPIDRTVETTDVGAGRGPDAATDRSEAIDDSETATAGITTVDSILDHIRQAAGSPVRFRHASDVDVRHFHVRAIPTGSVDHGGYLLFTDVTGPERRRRDLATENARLERIASVARHDLRNPLEVARIRLEAAQDTGEAVHFEKVAGALDRIERITHDVLGLGGGGIEPTDRIALETVIEAGWDTVDTADATLISASGLPTIRGDADRLQQLFENLFRNAVEHGGRDVTVRVETLPDGFLVADDGPGVAPDLHGHAFEPGTSTAPDNSGLGLSIVRRIARAHGWRVSLASDRRPASEREDGARFVFTGVEALGR